MNVKLLNQVANAILDEPTRFDMSTWVEYSTSSTCGTTACIAGHAVAIAREFPSLKSVKSMDDGDMLAVVVAARWLIDSPNCSALFHVDEWPTEFRHELYDTNTPEEYADVGFWRIQAFIADNETDEDATHEA